MVDQKKLGGNWIHKSPGAFSAVFFVHGILSSGESAWAHPNGACWPRMLALETDLPPVDVSTFSYRADWRAGTYSVSDAVDSFRAFMDYSHLWQVPNLIFVCHSMGGILIRRFLVANQLKLIAGRNRIALFLIASPSLGASDANRILWLSRMLANTQSEALRFSESNVWLNDLDKDFLKLKESGELSLTGKELIEDEPVRLKKLLGLWTKVVQPFSAARYFSDALKIAGSDHSSIAKPASRGSEQHLVLKEFIRNFIANDPPILARLDQNESRQAIEALTAIKDRLGEGGITKFEVLAAIQEALLETRAYLERRRSGEERDPKTEWLLSRVWDSAGTAAQPYDPQLARLCWVKGHGWADPSVWDDPEFKDLPTSVNKMLRKILDVTQQASESARTINNTIDIAEGTLTIDTVAWRTVVLLPPFASPPGITLSRRNHGPGDAPEVEAVTADTFVARIRSSDQSGEWRWRARGIKIADGIDIVQGTVNLEGSIGKMAVLLPPFVTPPQVAITRHPDGRTPQDPVVDEVTADKFCISINSSQLSGAWIWRARGSLIR